MTVQPTAPSYSGEVTVTLGGQSRSFRFGMNTLRDYTALTGSPAGQLGNDLVQDSNATLLNLVYVAVKRYTPADQLPADFSLDRLADWMDDISEAEASVLATAVIRSIMVQNPLTTALVAQLTPLVPTPAPATDGTTSSTSPSAT